ncbi:lactonase family protein [Lutibacter holmesii]|uniref:Lactonase family protein n=1 Tax=Lutibacter holmesii TaxID=1137985 RepID=A0ABW3WMH9_9FLAO
MKTVFTVLFVFISQIIVAQHVPLYVGSYTNTESEGIYYYSFNTNTGTLSNKKLAVKAENPSFITFSANKDFLYAVSESDKESTVASYAVTENGTLNLLNKVSSNGSGPCHIQLNQSSTKAVVSNYGGGTVSIYNLQKNGSFINAFQVVNNNIPGVPAHAHSGKFYNNELFVADLGRNFLSQYVEKDNTYVLKKNYMMAKKAGPRHFEISKNGSFIYVINELNSTITALKRVEDTYTEIQTISTLKDGFIGMNACADIHLSNNQQFLYGSNRGENTIVVYKRNLETGLLSKIQSIFVEGDWPRNFTLSPNGKFLLVANQRSNNISVYNVQKETGKLTFMYSEACVSPVCLLF